MKEARLSLNFAFLSWQPLIVYEDSEHDSEAKQWREAVLVINPTPQSGEISWSHLRLIRFQPISAFLLSYTF